MADLISGISGITSSGGDGSGAAQCCGRYLSSGWLLSCQCRALITWIRMRTGAKSSEGEVQSCKRGSRGGDMSYPGSVQVIVLFPISWCRLFGVAALVVVF